ncbi:MAG: hypothetical protein ABFS34_05490 [Gemmatimonadota bacterium]
MRIASWLRVEATVRVVERGGKPRQFGGRLRRAWPYLSLAHGAAGLLADAILARALSAR